jgi:soluble lytic murein transglycosylase-like protein
MRWFWLIPVAIAYGQQPPEAKVRAAMQPAVERQRQAARKQSESPASPEAFFLLPPFLLAPPGALGSPWPLAPDCPALGEPELKSLAAEAAQAAGIKPEWLLAVVARKSQGRPCAVSPAGAAGLMQLMPAAIEELKVADALDPRQNLAAGARLVKQLLDRNGGDLERALAAYDAGPLSRPGPSSSPLPAENPASGDDKNK